MNNMADPFGLAGDTLNASRSPYIAVVINSTAFSIPHEFVKEGLTGAQKLMRSLKEEARKTYGGPHPNRNHQHEVAVHVEIITDKETWKALFTNSVEFIDGCNRDNTCRISYHADFTKVAEELLRTQLLDRNCKMIYLASGSNYGAQQMEERLRNVPESDGRLVCGGGPAKTQRKRPLNAYGCALDLSNLLNVLHGVDDGATPAGWESITTQE